MSSRLVILDANIIIAAFKYKFWNSLVSHFRVSVNSIVLREEVYFFIDEYGQKVPIDLLKMLTDDQIDEITATSDQMNSLISSVNPNFADRIDNGELEAIALLRTGEFDDFRYCTSDTRAIKALSSLGLGALGVSLEELLIEVRQNSKLPDPSFSKKAFEIQKQKGFLEKDLFLKKD